MLGRPSLAPGRYCRLLVLGYFEGLDSERAMAWRALHLELPESAPDHSTISNTDFHHGLLEDRQWIDVDRRSTQEPRSLLKRRL